MNLLSKILLILLVPLIYLYPQNTENISSRINSFLSDQEFLGQTTVALEVFDLTAARTIYSLNGRLLLRPASNMKLLSSAAGILFLKDYSFKTTILYTGEIVNGKLLGDLFIKGGCDPAFTLQDIDSMIISLKNAGVNEITGDIYADITFKDNLIWGKGWMWDDDPSSDAPYLSALNLNNNVVTIYVSPGETGTPVVRLDPPTAYFKVRNTAAVLNNYEEETLLITRDWINRTNDIEINGNINRSDTTERVKQINVFDPVGYFMFYFRERIAEYLITFNGDLLIAETPPAAEELFVKQTPVDSILNKINKESDNLSAEMVIYALAEKYFGKPAAAVNGLLMVDSLIKLAGLNPSDYLLADGSGVSHYNLLSAELLTSILKYLYYQQPDAFEKLYNSLALAGEDGTLVNRMKETPANGRVHGKTGTLTGVSCLSGYIDSISGRKLAFSIMVQSFAGDASYARYLQDELCRIITGYE